MRSRVNARSFKVSWSIWHASVSWSLPHEIVSQACRQGPHIWCLWYYAGFRCSQMSVGDAPRRICPGPKNMIQIRNCTGMLDWWLVDPCIPIFDFQIGWDHEPGDWKRTVQKSSARRMLVPSGHWLRTTVVTCCNPRVGNLDKQGSWTRSWSPFECLPKMSQQSSQEKWLSRG